MLSNIYCSGQNKIEGIRGIYNPEGRKGGKKFLKVLDCSLSEIWITKAISNREAYLWFLAQRF